MRGGFNCSVQRLNNFKSMLCSAFLNSLLTVASVQYFSFNTKLQPIILGNRKTIKNSIHIQKDSGNFHVPLSSQLRKETKLKFPLCTGTPQPWSEPLSTLYLQEQICGTFHARPFVGACPI